MSFNERGHPINDERLHNAIGSSSSSSSSSRRWIPPTNAPHHHHHQHITATAAAPAFQKNIDSDRSMQYNDRENNYRRIEGGLSGRGSGGRQGGGKLMRQHRHSSNDTYNQRNLHRRPMPPQHKNIITPTDTTKPSFSASQSVFTTPCPTTATGPTATNNNNNTNDDTRKLNPTDPTEARRINQRLRQVLFGKNTVGYEEYIKRVPKHKRKHRSLECPMTPDHRADIPTKRWQGLLNAW